MCAPAPAALPSGVDPGTGHDDEAVLLQNQGALKVYLAGYTILAVGGEAGTGRVWHVFREEAVIPPRGYVLLRTAVGVPCAAAPGMGTKCSWITRAAKRR